MCLHDILSINNKEFENDVYLGQMYPVEHEIKYTKTATLLLLTWIYYCWSGRSQLHTSINDKRNDFNFHIIVVCSCLAIYQLRPYMVSLSRSIYDMPEVGPRMNVLFWGQHAYDFQISFSNRDTSRNAWNCHFRSVMVDTGTVSNNAKFLSYEF